MDSNKICSKIITKVMAERFLKLITGFHMLATEVLASDSNMDWSSQKVSAWDMNTSPHRDPLDRAIFDAKTTFSSRHIMCSESVKELKYDDYSYKWPKSLEYASLWNAFWRAIAEDSPIYQMRNWYAHEFGSMKISLGQEKEKFVKLLQAYRDLLPTLEELMGKLSAGIKDDAAWASESVVKERMRLPDQPTYTLDCEAVLLHIRQKEEERVTRFEEDERMYKARLAQAEEEKENPWGCREWVQMEDVGEEWGQSSMATVEGSEDVELLGSAQDDTSENEDWACCDDGGEGLPADVSRPAVGGDEAASDSAYEDSIADGITQHCPTCACKVPCGRQGAVWGSRSVWRIRWIPPRVIIGTLGWLLFFV